jgi:hypothetical protein
VTVLVRSGPPHDDDLEALRSQAAEREAALAERLQEIARAKTDLAAFRIRYRREVGLLHEELDELDRAIAEAELGELSKRIEEGGQPDASTTADSPPEDSPRFTSDVVRRLFREVAKTIHPDLARDDATRDQRHALMIEANRAYALGDEDRLRWILQAWERSPEAVQGSDREAAQLRLLRRIDQIEAQLTECDRDLATLQESPLWKLKAMVDEAAERGKDLVADMVRRLERDVTAARNRLDAMRWNP